MPSSSAIAQARRTGALSRRVLAGASRRTVGQDGRSRDWWKSVAGWWAFDGPVTVTYQGRPLLSLEAD